jgi:hypothetical protein
MTRLTIAQQLTLARSKNLLDARGRITNAAMEQARKACEALARRMGEHPELSNGKE